MSPNLDDVSRDANLFRKSFTDPAGLGRGAADFYHGVQGGCRVYALANASPAHRPNDQGAQVPVHPNVLSCLLHLRLRTELDQMREGKGRNKANGQPEVKGKFKSEIRKKWATKNQRKREKELKEVQKEMAEAEAEVDKEERAVTVRQGNICADVPLTLRSKQRS